MDTQIHTYIFNTHIHNITVIEMAYDSETHEPLHPLTPEGEEAYRLMLELKADEILFKSKHPFKYWIQRLVNLIKTGDSTWDGAHYPPEEKYKDGYSYVR